MDVPEKKYVLGEQLVIAETQMKVITIVGSCVGVYLRDRKTRTVGMNHCALQSVGDVTNL